MTISEIRATEKPFLVPTDLTEILGCDAHTVRVAARKAPELLGFNVCVMGSRVKIPRLAFLRWYDGINSSDTDQSSDSPAVNVRRS